MKTYIKIYGPPIIDALRALEEVAREFSKRHPGIKYFHYLSLLEAGVSPEEVRERRGLISESGWSLGDYDFYFEWTRPPTFEELNELIELIDKALSKVGCEYTITTK